MATVETTSAPVATLGEVPILRDRELELVLVRRSGPDLRRSWAPAYHFEMRQRHGDTVGWIDFRVTNTAVVRLYNGHIGYTVRERYRGHRYAARSCQLLFDLARQHGFSELWITCNPENVASRRTCELIGAEYVETVELPKDSDLYRRGERQKCRYRVELRPQPPE